MSFCLLFGCLVEFGVQAKCLVSVVAVSSVCCQVLSYVNIGLVA